MPSYEHSKLIECITHLDTLPENNADYAAWTKGDGHLGLLRENAAADELVIYASSKCTFIHTVIINEGNISPLDQDDLLHWSGNPYFGCAGYEWGEG